MISYPLFYIFYIPYCNIGIPHNTRNQSTTDEWFIETLTYTDYYKW